ncbi:hypothetical protein LNV08_05870 [Paucibacter sp. TC2R-5]|uniref:hypothetical protein n=1 Tax=Paucibacter sp. TC2R-5 TaxID=2893555 RepID=UPI0021E4F962|nr:hypothetical protein [Paucibacter sp. TC2R-5]MCV2358499.1 hypothetical protein [Paucibacter sp. TC2R-5]
MGSVSLFRALGLGCLLVLAGAVGGCSAGAGGKAVANDDIEKTYWTGSRIPYKGQQPIAKGDKEFARDAIREQSATSAAAAAGK